MMLVDAGKLLPMISWRNTFRPFADATVALEKVKTRGERRLNLFPPRGNQRSGICSRKPRVLPAVTSAAGWRRFMRKVI